MVVETALFVSLFAREPISLGGLQVCICALVGGCAKRRILFKREDLGLVIQLNRSRTQM
jgi:hypothetical protein